jgi:hypothetical protein
MQCSLVIFLYLTINATTALLTPSPSSLHYYRHKEPPLQGIAQSSSSDGAKFVKLDSDSNANISPPALLVCNSGDILSEYHLETLDDIVLAAVSSLAPVPVLLLGQDDRKSTLRKLLLDPAVLESRDHLLPSRPMIGPKKPACILFSGCDRSSISATIQGIRSWNPPGSDSGSSFPEIAFAMVVPNALDKPLELLIKEILNDYSENNKA